MKSRFKIGDEVVFKDPNNTDHPRSTNVQVVVSLPLPGADFYTVKDSETQVETNADSSALKYVSVLESATITPSGELFVMGRGRTPIIYFDVSPRHLEEVSDIAQLYSEVAEVMEEILHEDDQILNKKAEQAYYIFGRNSVNTAWSELIPMQRAYWAEKVNDLINLED